MMRTSISGLLAAAFLGLGTTAHADTAWSTQDYALYPGDFNGDGLTDMLYVARDSAHLSGITLSDGSGFNIPLQSWGNAYLGIPWSDDLYTIVVADFDGDGKDDLFLQRKTPGDHYLLLTEETGVRAISETLANDAAGLDWSGRSHHLVAGDFNGDGRADLFLQASEPDGLNAVIITGAEGLITADAPDQAWEDGYAGFDWAVSAALVYTGDFNGDGRADLLLQARPLAGTGTSTENPAVYLPNTNGVMFAQAAGALFVIEAAQAWSRDGFKAEWSPLSSVLSVADFNADGRSDVLLQGQGADDASYLLHGRAKGPIFESAQRIEAGKLPAAESHQLLPGARGWSPGSLSSTAAEARTE